MDSVVAVCNYNTIVVLSTSDLTELWRDSFPGGLFTLAIDEGAGLLAMQFAVRTEGYGFFRVVPIRSGQQLAESVRIPSLGRSALRNSDITWFSGNVISQWGPQEADLGTFNPAQQCSTMFLQWDGQSQSLSEPVIVSGIFRVTAQQAGADRYVRMDDRGKVSLVTIAPK